MGQEIECRMHYDGRVLAGRAYLEGDHILFRGTDRVRIPLKDVRDAKAEAGTLRLETAGGPVLLQMGAAAEKWAVKILHPPSRAEKLGVKPGLEVRVIGAFEAAFAEELSTLAAAKKQADLVFWAVGTAKELARIAKVAGGLKTTGALWVVYPKGVTEIREIEVIEAGRSAGLKDVKVVRFSATHTALKFVIPVSRRAARI
ncbi:MAG TPA: hypothetical protein VMS37_29255 [Verrucomicrobiae bacterium]|nr:hypothetical protein [Verrucomicrobiae bacterium]